MAVYFITISAADLLKKFNAAIDQEEPKGKINTWEKVTQGNATFYTHEAKQWRRKAFLKAKVEDESLSFTFVNPAGKEVDQDIYAYYQGHLVETFTRHFSTLFVEAHSTALACPPDQLKSKKSS